MEWGIEESKYVIPLGGTMMGILPDAPQEMKDFAINDLNKSNFKAYGYNEYVGLNPDKQRILKLKNPLPIFKTQENRVCAYLPSGGKVVSQWFPEYGVQIQDGYIIGIMESLREDYLLCIQKSFFDLNKFNPSCLDVDGE